MALNIALATRNKGKIAEIMDILSPLDIELVLPDAQPSLEEPEETGQTFLENALIKAQRVFEVTGIPALADDSGLEVDVLDGAPGILSARYGGEGLTDEEKYTKLLEALKGIPDEKRTARFMCVTVLYPAPNSSGKYLATEGYLHGRIAEEPAGSNGFGYDPVFYLPEKGLTVAQLGVQEKNLISHRYRALVELKWILVNEYGVNLKE